MSKFQKNITFIGIVIIILLILISCIGGGKELEPVTKKSLTYEHFVPEKDPIPSQSPNATLTPGVTSGVTPGVTKPAEETPSVTPAPSPNVEEIDTTKIVSKYDAKPDTTGLEVIDQKKLGNTSEIKYLKGMTEKGAVVEIINGTTFVNGLLMVNKTYSLPSYYVPTNTHANVVNEDYVNEGLTAEAWDAWIELQNAAKAEGLNIYISSAYRSYKKQEETWNNYASWYSKEKADTFSARAGSSEHQSGLCFDLNSISDAFLNTPEGQWIDKNCQKYGFCIRFPKDKDEITGYKYECWHLRYVGTELATELYNDGSWLSMEEYFGLESKYSEETTE